MSQPRASTSGSAAAAAGGAAAEFSTAAAGGMAVAPPTSSPASTSSRKKDEALTRATGTSDSWAMESSIDLCRRASSGRRGRPQFCFTPRKFSFTPAKAATRELRSSRLQRAHLARRSRLLPPLRSPHLRRRSFLVPTWRASTPATSRTASSTASASACTWTARGTRATGSRASRAAAARTRLPAVRAPPPQFHRHRRRLTSPHAAPQATNSRASGRMGGCTGSACTPGKLATSTSAR